MMIERLLVPVADDSLDMRALTVSIDLAQQLGAAITGLIVEPFASAPRPPGWVVGLHGSDADAALQAHAEGVLARFAQHAREAGVPFRGLATQASNIADAIVAAAAEHRCDIIVMATHDRKGLSKVLWRSTTQDVMSRTTLPVLVLQ
jgi:nucleotide-binding universal stress UspA family protein